MRGPLALLIPFAFAFASPALGQTPAPRPTPPATSPASPLAPAAPASPVQAASASAPAIGRFAGRGVYYFGGHIRCPLAGVGGRGEYECNRLVIDDQYSQVTIDRQAHRISLVNTHSYDKKQIVGDFLFLGFGMTADGVRAPVGIHAKIERKGNTFSTDVHAHPSVRESLVSADFEPFTIVIRDSAGETVALTKEQALQNIRDPGIGLRLASKLLTAWDNLEGVQQSVSSPGYILVDVSFGFGIGGLSQKLLRMQIVSVEGTNAPLLQKGGLADMLQKGVWELRLRALSSLGGDAFERDLFLIGIDGLPLLRPLIKDGMEKDDMLTIRLRSGRGTVFFGNQGQPIQNASDVARAYLEFNALGAILANQVTVRHPQH